MEEPEKILSRIMDFERTYTPRFTDLIKQSLIDNVDIDDDTDNDIHPKSDRYPFQSPLTTFINHTIALKQPNIENHAISLSQPLPNAMPSYTNNNTKKPHQHQHKATPIMARVGSNSNNIKIIDTNSFLITDDLQYHSESDEDADDDLFIQQDYDLGVDGDEFADDTPLHPLIEEYNSVSRDIHKSKLKLRKLDRQMTMALRQNESQSPFVKQHSDIKIKIAHLISKRRELETHDIVKQYVKEEEGDRSTVEIDVSGSNDLIDNEQQRFMDDGALMEINEDEEEEDEIEHNAVSPSSNDIRSDSDDRDREVDDDALGDALNGINGINTYNDESRTTSSTMNDFYSYDADIIFKPEYEAEEEPLSGSVKFHSDEEEDDENNGSVEYHSGSESDDGSLKIHGSDSNRGDVFDEYEDDGDESDGGGSVQMNECENEENWVDEEFDSKVMEFDSNNKENEDEEEDEGELEQKDEHKASSRRTRLQQMKAHKNYKDYVDDEHHEHDDLDELKHKYRDRRRNREQISEIEDYSFNDLVAGMDADVLTYKFEADDDDEAFPSIPSMNKDSILLDINHLSAKLANIVEEDDSEDDQEKCFQTVEYQTDSDCDSNDSVVVKKEIVKNVTVNEINDMKNFE